MIMNMNINTRLSSSHLYDPKKEGLGSYDANYINAYKKIERIRQNKTSKLRYPG